MNTNRKNELLSGMESFNKESFHRSELLDEMMKLQSELVMLTFNEEHAAIANLRLWDVEQHLKDLNEQLGNVADKELEKFISESKVLCNLIKAEVSGHRGEYKAFSVLEHLKSKNIVLKNVELSDGDLRTEIDALVITPAGLTIVEVKNTSRNIFIDENGSYYRTGEFLKWDCNISEKMALKERLLRKTLENAETMIPNITKLVVFTDNRIEVQNKCKEIRTCFVSQLTYIIDGLRETCIFTEGIMEQLETVILAASNEERYPFEFDVNTYKNDFADLMVLLEEASAKEEADDEVMIETEEAVHTAESFGEKVRRFLDSKYVRFAGRAAAYVLVPLASGVITATAIQKGGIMK